MKPDEILMWCARCSKSYALYYEVDLWQALTFHRRNGQCA